MPTASWIHSWGCLAAWVRTVSSGTATSGCCLRPFSLASRCCAANVTWYAPGRGVKSDGVVRKRSWNFLLARPFAFSVAYFFCVRCFFHSAWRRSRRGSRTTPGPPRTCCGLCCPLCWTQVRVGREHPHFLPPHRLSSCTPRRPNVTALLGAPVLSAHSAATCVTDTHCVCALVGECAFPSPLWSLNL